jgi:hypothetical protein
MPASFRIMVRLPRSERQTKYKLQLPRIVGLVRNLPSLDIGFSIFAEVFGALFPAR